MSLSSPPGAPSPWSPLNLAGYVTWVAVALEPLLRSWQGSAPPDLRTVIGLAALVGVLALFVARSLLESRQPASSGSTPAARRLVLAQLPCALAAIALLPPGGSTPILLIVVAAQLTGHLPARTAAGLLLAANAVLAWILLARWSVPTALVTLLAYGGFQAFAALTTHYVRRAEEARDALSRINAELLATRELLQESTRGEERLRLSRELHDVAGHKLTTLKLQLRLLERTVDAGNRAAVADCTALSDELLADVRGVVQALRVHDGVDLQSALAALVPNVPQPRVVLALDPHARPATVEHAQALVRIAQEALTNARRHAGAQEVTLRLERADGAVVLTVSDDGRAAAPPLEGNGLRGMRERLSGCGGSLSIAPRSGGGLQLVATVPA